jgi:autotransporter-associated beta strand protein
VLYLNGANTYTGPTTVSVGVLAGTGSIAGPVTVQTNGSIGGGSGPAIGTLTIGNNLTLDGNVFIRVNKSLYPAQSNDMVSVSGALANIGTGTVTVTNSGGGSLAVGDRFQIFSQPVTSGSTLVVTGGGMNWTNRLAVDGSITALSIANTVNPNPTNIVFTVSGSTLNLSWPVDHTGWVLQSQTNSVAVGLSTNWESVPGSGSANTATFTANPGNGAVFYRLVLPAQ